MTNTAWSAADYFAELTAQNLLARQHKFICCECSGLDGFEEALRVAQHRSNFVCVSDTSDGYTDMQQPNTRRVKTVFLAMRHAADNMKARAECMQVMRELFRQFASRLMTDIRRYPGMQQLRLDPRIQFSEIDRYFFTGCACAYFQIAVDQPTDLRYNGAEWDNDNPS